MRKITLLLALMAFVGSTFAQYANQTPLFRESAKEISKTRTPKASGDVLFLETFDRDEWALTVDGDAATGYEANGSELPGNWVVKDNTGNDYVWHWSDVGPRGANIATTYNVPDNYWIDPAWYPEGTTLDDGFIMMENDWYNTTANGQTVTNPVKMDSYIMYGPFDCSDKDGLIVGFNTFYALCCDFTTFLDLKVSNDYDPNDPSTANWTTYPINVLTPTGKLTNPKERRVEKNISAVAGGQSSVYFKIHITVAQMWFVILDDISLFESPVNDVQIWDAWADYSYIDAGGESRDFEGGYSAIPQSVLSEFKQFRAYTFNNGSAEATNTELTVKIYEDGVRIDSLVSQSTNIAAGTGDTLKIPTSFAPANIANYQVSMTASSDAVDEFPGNQGWSYDFSVTENTFSRVRHGKEDDFSRTGTYVWASATQQNEILTQTYLVEEGRSATFSGVNIYITDDYEDDEKEAIADGKYIMTARAFGWDDEASSRYDLGIESDPYVLKTSDLGTWVYLPYIDEGDLFQEEGYYWIGVIFETGSTSHNFRIGSDANGIKQPDGAAVWADASGKWWNGGDGNYAIDLMVNMPEMIDVTFEYDMVHEEIVAGDVITVQGSFAEEEITLTYDAASDKAIGKISMESSDTETEITYLAYLNGNEEYVVSDERKIRTVNVSNANVTETPIFGQPVGIAVKELELVSIYPNPFANTLTLDNLTNVSEIIISNVLGQTVLTVNDIENTVEISTSNLENGVYLITIVDADNNMRTERVVKK